MEMRIIRKFIRILWSNAVHKIKKKENIPNRSSSNKISGKTKKKTHIS